MEKLENLEQEKDNLAEEQGLLDAYKNLQNNSVSKEKYDADIKALKEKNDLYLKAITEGRKVDLPADENVSMEQRIQELNKFRGTNLQYWEKMSPAIDALLKELPESEIVKITGEEGLEEIIRVNEGMKKMIEDSNGDADYFRSLYKARVKDSAPRISAEIEKAGSLANYLVEKSK